MGQKQIEAKLIESIRADKSEKVKEIILKHQGQVINSYVDKTKNFTPLMFCAYFDSISTFKQLLELGATWKHKHFEIGNTLIHIAAGRGNIRFLKEIYSTLKDDPNFNINEINAYEMTCLDYAIIKKQYITCFYLVHELKMEIKKYEEYVKMIYNLNLPEFNVKKFINYLTNEIPFEKTPSFLFEVRLVEEAKKQHRNMIKKDESNQKIMFDVINYLIEKEEEQAIRKLKQSKELIIIREKNTNNALNEVVSINNLVNQNKNSTIVSSNVVDGLINNIREKEENNNIKEEKLYVVEVYSDKSSNELDRNKSNSFISN